MVTVQQAAKRLKVGRARVQQFIASGRIKTVKDSLTGWHLIDVDELEKFQQVPRRPGPRSKKSA